MIYYKLQNKNPDWFSDFTKVQKRMHQKNVQEFLLALTKIPPKANYKEEFIQTCLDLMDGFEAIDLALIELLYPQIENRNQLGYLAALQYDNLFDLSYLLDLTGTPDIELVKQEWGLSDRHVTEYLVKWREVGINPEKLPTFLRKIGGRSREKAVLKPDKVY